MCGPPDLEALHTCITRLGALSAAGLTTYSVCKTAAICRRLRSKRGRRAERASQELPAGLAAEGSSGHPDT